MPRETPEKGDEVSWNWGGSGPSGEVADKKTEGEAAVTSKRGNTITKPADPDDPALEITRSGNDVVKKQSEVEVEEKATKNKTKTPKSKTTPKKAASAKKGAAAVEDGEEDADAADAPKTNGSIKNPKKRGREEDDTAEDKPAPKKRGRPAGGASKAKAAPKASTGRPRGRPKTEGGPAKVEKPKVLGADGKPRGRGRPPKKTSTSSPKKAAAKPAAKGSRRSTRK